MLKWLAWIGDTKKDLLAFPEAVVSEIGHALYVAQCGGKHKSAKALKGFGDAGILEVVENYAGDTYRAVYTVRFAEVAYVLHVFQKKSKKGIATPASEMKAIEARLTRAKAEYDRWKKESL